MGSAHEHLLEQARNAWQDVCAADDHKRHPKPIREQYLLTTKQQDELQLSIKMHKVTAERAFDQHITRVEGWGSATWQSKTDFRV